MRLNKHRAQLSELTNSDRIVIASRLGDQLEPNIGGGVNKEGKGLEDTQWLTKATSSQACHHMMATVKILAPAASEPSACRASAGCSPTCGACSARGALVL
eukprot:5976692-Amphidinium_carterae.1